MNLRKIFLESKRFSSRRWYSSQANRPIILGIESSCDDTGAAIVNRSGSVLGECLNSQLKTHLMFGGIIPPVAQSFHRNNIETVVENTLRNAKMTIQDIDAIAVTNRPGLTLSLLVGLRYAKHLCRVHSKPMIPIHHMEAHALAARIENKVEFPYLCLLVSGGHSLLAFVKNVTDFYLLGETLDDAPGEAFDKTARKLKLRNVPGFEWKSGGSAIELAASQSTLNESGKYQFPLPLSRYKDCQFSFAGMKNTARKFIDREERALQLAVDQVIPDYRDFCKSFLAGITRHICNRTQRAIEYCDEENMFEGKERTLVVSGGVACNDFIFTGVSQLCEEFKFKAVRPSHKLCTDNGVMIAWNGVERLLVNNNELVYDTSGLMVHPKCPLGVSIIDKVKAKNVNCKWAKLPLLRNYV